MNERIEKKLSKRLMEVAPSLFSDAWVDSCGVYCVGGGINEWGEGEDDYTLWEFWSTEYMWFGDFPDDENGYPDTTGFKPTPSNLIKLAKQLESKNEQTTSM